MYGRVDSLDTLIRGRRGAAPFHHVPTSFLDCYSSQKRYGATGQWVTGRFSLHSDRLLYVGGDDGSVALIDVASVNPDDDGIVDSFSAHTAVVMDVVGVPERPNQLVTISGDQTVRLWDLEHESSMLYFGHDKSVRSIAFSPDSPFTFCTGGRDGHILLWDSRVSAVPVARGGGLCRKPVHHIHSAHALDVLTGRTTPSRRRRGGATPTRKKGEHPHPPPSITSIICTDDHTVLSASSHSKSGIRVWDTRRLSAHSDPVSTLRIPSHKGKETGVASMCLDRTRTRVFAASTDNIIYEYLTATTATTPARAYVGSTMDTFYVQVACSPTTDHLICGSTKGTAANVWDIQPSSSPSTSREPIWTIGGHLSNVLSVTWSCAGSYIVTMDEEQFRVWECRPDERKGPSDDGLTWWEKSERYLRSDSDKNSTLSLINNVHLSPAPRVALSPLKMAMTTPSSRTRTPQSKRRLMQSPFKLPSTGKENAHKSPSAKMLRLTSPSPRKQLFVDASPMHRPSPSRGLRHRSKNPFYYAYPTMHLPNFVYENYLRLLSGPAATPTASSSKERRAPMSASQRIEEWVRRSGDGEKRLERIRVPASVESSAACSQMISEQERLEMKSPRKLLLKPIDPPKADPARRKSSSRNILDYFKKK